MTAQLIHQKTEKGLELSLSGRLEAGQASALAREISGLVEGPTRRVVIDLAELDYISSAGLEMLLSVFQAISLKDGYLALAGAKGQVAEGLELSGLGAVFTQAGSVAQAWQQI